MSSKKKVLIVTLPLGRNYGGILQAYALQQATGYIGVDSVTGYPYLGRLNWILGSIKDLMIRLKGGHREGRQTPGAEAYTTKHTRTFIESRMKTVKMPGYSLVRNSHFDAEFDGFIAGSDQVWRGYRALPYYMLGFSNDQNKKRLSYAASFGVSDPKFSQDTVLKVAGCVGRMDGLSVREYEGIDVMHRYWGASAVQHIDPTLLLDAEKYSLLIDSAQSHENKGSLFVYVLDRSVRNDEIVKAVRDATKTSSFELLPKEYKGYVGFLRNRRAYVMPSVEQWLRSFRDAEYVVTDSFHGTVFSIIFNKQFIVIGNKERGLARFTSLLRMLGLENRLVTSPDDLTDELIQESINWNTVNSQIELEKKRSFDYLKKHLG